MIVLYNVARDFFLHHVYVGSVTLHHWQQLAKPNLGGILLPRPGILTKDFRELDVDVQQVYSLNDFEEDEPNWSKLHNPIHIPTGKDLLFSQFTVWWEWLKLQYQQGALLDWKFTGHYAS